MTDHYKILGINRNASQEDIRSAFRKLSVKLHPDKNDGDRYFANMFVQVREAYEFPRWCERLARTHNNKI